MTRKTCFKCGEEKSMGDKVEPFEFWDNGSGLRVRIGNIELPKEHFIHWVRRMYATSDAIMHEYGAESLSGNDGGKVEHD